MFQVNYFTNSHLYHALLLLVNSNFPKSWRPKILIEFKYKLVSVLLSHCTDVSVSVRLTYTQDIWPYHHGHHGKCYLYYNTESNLWTLCNWKVWLIMYIEYKHLCQNVKNKYLWKSISFWNENKFIKKILFLIPFWKQIFWTIIRNEIKHTVNQIHKVNIIL